jgi:NitT/TauT family transport system ATP-binding protein
MGETSGRITEVARVIRVNGLSKAFAGRQGRVQALDGINLEVRDNEFLALLGPSGCGKTTLLRMIGGLVPWDDGQILIDGSPVTGPGPDRSIVFQNFALMPWASVLDNVGFGLEMRKVARSEREARSRELIKLVGLEGFEKAMPFELSGGMQQRVGLARALAVQPRILLMDEPFSAVDEQTRRILQEELLQIWETHRTTVVFVTHSIEEAVLLADRVVLMSARPGRIREIVDIPLERPRIRAVESEEGARALGALTTSLWDSLRTMQVPEQ